MANAARTGSARPPPPSQAPRARAPAAQLSDDPDFRRKNRLILAALKASHHLANCVGPEPLPVVARLAENLRVSIRPAVPNAATAQLIDGNARNLEHTTMLVLRDHYKAALEEKVSALLLLSDPIWRPNFVVALAWAQRHFGERLRPETVEALRARLRDTLDTLVRLVQLFPDIAPGAALPRFNPPEASPPPAPGFRTPGPGPIDLNMGAWPADRRSRLPSPTLSLAFSSSPSSPPLCPPIPPASPPPSSSSSVPPTPSPPRLAVPGPPRSNTPLARRTRLASCRLRRRTAATRAPGPSSPSSAPAPLHGVLTPAAVPVRVISPTPSSSLPLPPSGSTPTHGLARANAERNDAAADARGPAGPALPISTPTVTLARPTRHPSTGKKCQEWGLQSREPLLVIGDSNVTRFAEYGLPGLQIDGYPGASFRHASAVLAKTAVDPKVRKLVLAFGINERGNKTERVCVGNLQTAVKWARIAFPCAAILIPEINYSRALPFREQELLSKLNTFISTRYESIPALPKKSFVTERDNVHWSRDTAALLFGQWVKFLN